MTLEEFTRHFTLASQRVFSFEHSPARPWARVFDFLVWLGMPKTRFSTGGNWETSQAA